jgi:hypothetical protein
MKKPKPHIKSRPPEIWEQSVTPEGVNLIALSSDRDDMRYAAYRIASEFKSGNYLEGFAKVCSFGERYGREHILRLLELIILAYKDSARFEPTPDRRRIIEAYFAASPWRNGESVIPSLREVKEKFRERFPKGRMPADETFKRAFRELPPLRDWRKGRGGRPLGSRDQDKRKRRKKKTRSSKAR